MHTVETVYKHAFFILIFIILKKLEHYLVVKLISHLQFTDNYHKQSTQCSLGTNFFIEIRNAI